MGTDTEGQRLEHIIGISCGCQLLSEPREQQEGEGEKVSGSVRSDQDCQGELQRVSANAYTPFMEKDSGGKKQSLGNLAVFWPSIVAGGEPSTASHAQLGSYLI